MRPESLFSNTGPAFEKNLWDVLVRYANGEERAIEDYRRILFSLGYCPRAPQGEGLPPFPIVGPIAKQLFIADATSQRETVRVLLRWFADPTANVNYKERVVTILNERQGHYRRTYGPFPGGQPADRRPHQLEVAFEFDGPVDPVCLLLSDQLAHHGQVTTAQDLRPIRICRQCGKLFVRNRKSRFCPGGKCKAAYANQGPQRANAEYQFKRRMLRDREVLAPKRFEAVVRMRLAKVRRSKLKSAVKKWRTIFLKSLIESPRKSGGHSETKRHVNRR
jgi:hypothetical protein